MDFTTKDARGSAEIAQFCALRWPESGAPIVDEKTGDAVGVMVLGAASRSVQAALKLDAKARLISAKGKDDEVKALEDIQADIARSAARVTAGFVNVQRGEKDATVADAEWFYDLNMFNTASMLQPDPAKWQNLSFAQQVLAFSNEIGNYLGNG